MIGTAASPDFPCEKCEVRDKAICAALDDEELKKLNKIATSIRVRPGGTVFFEGDDSTFLFNVVAGGVRLSKMLPDGRRQITGFLFPGDLLGLSVAGVYAYTAESLTESALCRFDRTRLAEMLEEFPKLEHRVLALAANELTQAQEHLLLLGRKTAIERVSSLLIRLIDRIGRRDDVGQMVDLPMSRSDLADYLGLTTETVSRTFTRLREMGVVETPNARSVFVPAASELALQTGDF